MKRNITLTIDEDLAAELRQQKNFSALVNDLIKEYFGKMKAQSVSEVQTEINQTRREETKLKKKEESSVNNSELSGKEIESLQESSEIQKLSPTRIVRKFITRVIRGTTNDGK